MLAGDASLFERQMRGSRGRKNNFTNAHYAPSCNTAPVSSVTHTYKRAPVLTPSLSTLFHFRDIYAYVPAVRNPLTVPDNFTTGTFYGYLYKSYTRPRRTHKVDEFVQNENELFNPFRSNEIN